MQTQNKENNATILLVSGDMDKAFLAFELAAGMAALGLNVNMWFVLFGVNCIKKPLPWYSPKKWKLSRNRSTGRDPDSDFFLQRVVRVLNADGANHLPLSQLNFGGLGPMILRSIMGRKGICPLERLIANARDLGVKFKVCQLCVDALALDVENDLVVEAEILGVTSYTRDMLNAHYNCTI